MSVASEPTATITTPEQRVAQLAACIRTLITIAIIAQRLLRAAGEKTQAHRITVVVHLARKLLIEAGEKAE